MLDVVRECAIVGYLIVLRCRWRAVRVYAMTSSLEEVLKMTAVSPSLLARLSVKGKVVFSVEQA